MEMPGKDDDDEADEADADGALAVCGGRATLDGNKPLCVNDWAFFIEAAC